MYVIRYIILSLFIGAIVVVGIMQQDEWVHQKLQEHITSVFDKEFDCNFSGTITYFSFFSSSMELSNISVLPHNCDEWSWSAKKIGMSFSWFHFFTTGTLDVHMKIYEWNANTSIKNNEAAIAYHMKQLFEKPTFPVPVDLTSVSMNKAIFSAHNKTLESFLTVTFNSRSYMGESGMKNTIYCIDGSVSLHGIQLLHGLSGSSHIEIINTDKQYAKIKIAGGFVLPSLENEQCYINGSWHDNYGRFSLTSAHDICSVDPVVIGKTKGRIISKFPVKLLSLFMPYFDIKNVLDGQCALSVVFDRAGTNGLHGQVVMRDIMYNDKQLCDTAKITLRATQESCFGVVNVRSSYGECDGKYSWSNNTKNGTATLVNTSTLIFPSIYWQVQPKKISIALSGTKETLDITGACEVMHSVSNQKHECSISMSKNKNYVTCSGAFDDTSFDYETFVDQISGMHEKVRKHIFAWKDKDDNLLFDCHAHHEINDLKAAVNGQVYFPAIRSIVAINLGYKLQGAGIVEFVGLCDEKKASVKVRLCDGTVRLPKTYNFIDSISTDVEFDFATRECRIQDTECHLHMGDARVQKGRFCFDDNWRCSFVHVPFFIDHCLINIEKDLFVTTSGALTVEKNIQGKPSCVRGTIFLDRAQLKKDAFSTKILKSIQKESSPRITTPYDFLCDIALKTVSPISISTPQITTDLSVRLQLQNQLTRPDISGDITLSGGRLEFPYRPLYIIRGNISFRTENSYDPVIELIAKNTIKHHDVTLHIAGSLREHHVMVSSAPNLTDEQIVALLLFGSPYESLSTLMPALITHNLEGLLLGEHKTSLINSYVKRIFKPISLHFVPRFTDQTGRGGIRGALDIDINDRLHVLLQKNFSLSEDTRFEVEYQLSDNIALRAIRDERRDIAGEVEMRWKF